MSCNFRLGLAFPAVRARPAGSHLPPTPGPHYRRQRLYRGSSLGALGPGLLSELQGLETRLQHQRRQLPALGRGDLRRHRQIAHGGHHLHLLLHLHRLHLLLLGAQLLRRRPPRRGRRGRRRGHRQVEALRGGSEALQELLQAQAFTGAASRTASAICHLPTVPMGCICRCMRLSRPKESFSNTLEGFMKASCALLIDQTPQEILQQHSWPHLHARPHVLLTIKTKPLNFKHILFIYSYTHIHTCRTIGYLN